MERYKDMSIRKKSKVKMIRNIVFFITLIVFTFWFVLRGQNLNELVQVIQKADKKYVLIAAILMLMVYGMESINVRSVLITLGEKKFSLLRAFKYTFIGSFFSAITPAATGGQPVEIYYMTKDNIKTVNGTMAMLLQLCGFQISTIVLSIICAILNPSLLKDSIIWFYILGIAINGFALSVMMIGIFSDKLARKLLNMNIRMMKKFKIKNMDKIQKKMEEGMGQYAKSATFIKQNKIVFLKAVLRVMIQIIFYHSIPYFIYRAFGLQELNYFQLFSRQAVLYTTVSGIPLPGSIGVSETLFLKLYGTVFGRTMLSGAMLLYRFVSFYFYLLVCAITVIIVVIRTKNIMSEVDNDIIEIEKVPKISKEKMSYC